MPHIHTGKDQHDLTVTAYIVRTSSAEPEALLHMHKKHHVLLPVGGHVELNETPWQAVAHELEEESGYKLDQLNVLQPVSRLKHMSKAVQHPVPVSMNTHYIAEDHFHTDIEYAFVTTSAPTAMIGDGESTDLRWLTKKELNELDASEIFDSTKEVYNFIFDEVVPNWESVSTRDFTLEYPENLRY